MIYRTLLVLFIVFFILPCKDSQPRQKEISFYHWQSEYALSSMERAYLQQLSVNKLYLRFFDVDWDANAKDAIAVGPVTFPDTQLTLKEIIPVVFITNRTMINIKEKNLEQLSQRIFDKLSRMYLPFKELNWREVQLDCDWTKKTEKKYFQLLHLLKTRFEKNQLLLSTTIRLHQVKYFKHTGVPPADKGMLMFYNTGDLENPETHNSILDLNTAAKYLVNFDQYPLPLDVALPLFSWGILFRDDQMIKLINNLDATHFLDDERFVKIAPNKFQVNKNTYLKGHYLYKDDWIKTEAVTFSTLKKAAELLTRKINNPQLTIAFYHLDTTTIKQYTYEQLNEICKIF